MRVEAVHGLRPALRHPFEHGGRFGSRAAGGCVHRERGLSSTLSERHGNHLLKTGDSLVVVSSALDNQPLGRDHLAIAAAYPVVLAVGRAHDEAKSTPWPGIGLARRHCEAFRAEPAREILRLRPGREDPFARRIKDARDLDRALVHFSASALRLARPSSNFVPTILSMLQKTLNSFDR